MNFKPQRNYGFTTFVDDVPDAIKYAGENDLKHVEINFSKQKTPLTALNDESIDTILKLADKEQVSLSFHIPFTENISDIIPFIRGKSIERLSAFIKVAGRLNAKSITVHPGIFYWFPIAKIKRTQALNRLVKGLKQMLEVCETSNVKIVLENLVQIPEGSEFYFLGDNIDDFKFIFEQIDSDYLGFCLDTGHANIGEGTHKYIIELANKLSAIHYHDNKGTKDNHLIIGDGNINWELVCRELTAINYNGPIISECRDIKPHKAAQLFEEKFNNVQAAIKPRQ